MTIDEEEDDLFVSCDNVKFAIQGDRVEIGIKKVADRLKGTAAKRKSLRFRTQPKTAVGMIVLMKIRPNIQATSSLKTRKLLRRFTSRVTFWYITGNGNPQVDIEAYPNKKRSDFVATIWDVVDIRMM